MKIGVVGVGYVGLITGVCLSYIGHKVVCYDVDEEKIEKLNNDQPPIFEKGLVDMMINVKKKIKYTTDKELAFHNIDVIFLAVGTPEDDKGLPNLSYIYQACYDIVKNIDNDCVVVIKSTVPVGTSEQIEKYFKANTTYKINVVSNPEFLSQGNAINDTLHAERIIIGCNNLKDIQIMKKLYMPLLKPPYNIPFIVTDRNSAEMIKYACNGFLALKISYINEIANLCKKNGANIEYVTKGMGYDNRIGKEFLKAGIGYGGSCFPKDTKALYEIAKYKNIELKTIKACMDVNEKQRCILFDEMVNNLKELKNKTIAILGVTFKPRTDDVRCSPAIENVKLLLKKGAIVNVYDPIGIANFKKCIKHKNLFYYENILKAIENCEAMLIITDWEDIKLLPIQTIIAKMKVPRIYDGRNCFSLEEIAKEKVYYSSIGRRTINNIHEIERESN